MPPRKRAETAATPQSDESDAEAQRQAKLRKAAAQIKFSARMGLTMVAPTSLRRGRSPD